MDKQDAFDARINPSVNHYSDVLVICCYGFWCHLCLYGENAEKINGSSCVGSCLIYWLSGMVYLCCLPHMRKRKALREKYRLQEEPCNDCLVSTLCAVCQEARELKSHDGRRENRNIVPVRNQPLPGLSKVKNTK